MMMLLNSLTNTDIMICFIIVLVVGVGYLLNATSYLSKTKKRWYQVLIIFLILVIWFVTIAYTLLTYHKGV